MKFKELSKFQWFLPTGFGETQYFIKLSENTALDVWHETVVTFVEIKSVISVEKTAILK